MFTCRTAIEDILDWVSQLQNLIGQAGDDLLNKLEEVIETSGLTADYKFQFDRNAVVAALCKDIGRISVTKSQVYLKLF